MDSYGNEWPGLAPKSTCLMPMWDGGYRMRCGLGAEGVCYKHGPHQSHPDDGRSCDPNPHDRYCHTHGVYMAPGLPADAL